jgi:hypothetical protein
MCDTARRHVGSNRRRLSWEEFPAFEKSQLGKTTFLSDTEQTPDTYWLRIVTVVVDANRSNLRRVSVVAERSASDIHAVSRSLARISPLAGPDGKYRQTSAEIQFGLLALCSEDTGDDSPSR